MTKALIIGIDSFTGHYVKDELVKTGYEVFGTVFNAPTHEPNLFKLNLLNKSEVTTVLKTVKPDVIIHLAGVSFVVQEDADILYTTHILGTRNLLSAASSLDNLKKIILASSAQVYGFGSDLENKELDESTFTHPNNEYAVSKLAMENMACLWMDKLPIIIARPFNYTGVGQHERFVIPKIVSAFKNKLQTIELGNINVYRDFSDVRFVAQTYRSLIENGKSGECYNISSGTATSLSEIIRILEGQTNHSIKIVKNNAFIRRNDPLKLVGSNHKLLTISNNLKPIKMTETLTWMLG